MTLRIAPGLELPDDFVTQSAAIVARRGAGKTYLACVLAEELIKADLPVVVIDPLGAFWGLRSSADGKNDGLQVVILGGDHGDIALEPTAGKLVADVIAEDPRPVILDLSAFESNAAQDRFAADFAERLYRAKAKSRTAMHLIVDEADSFAPQRPQPGQQRMLGAFEAIVRRGRIRGLGVTLITQRAAVLNKNVLTQAECLVTLQTTGPQDRKAIDDWIRGHGTDEERALLLDSLAGLQQGEAWFWSPAWLNIFQRIQVRRRETFDSSATPKAGALRVEPEHRVPLDLELLQKRMADTIERTKADDPRELRKQIAELDRELHAVQLLTPEPERVETIPARVIVVMREVAAAYDTAIGSAVAAHNEAMARFGSAHNRVVEALEYLQREAGPAAAAPRPAQRPDPPARREPRGAAVPGTAPCEGLTDYANALLTTLAQRHPLRLTKSQWSTMSGRSQRSSAFGPAIRELLNAGYVSQDGKTYELTDAGRDAVGVLDDAPASPRELLEMWVSKLPRQAGEFLHLIAHCAVVPDRETLSEVTGYSRTSSSFGPSLRLLVNHGLITIENDGSLVASPELWIGDR